MSDLPLTLVPKPILKQKAQKVTDFGPNLKRLAQDMAETMRHNNGMGLAAPQVGQPIRMITIEYEPNEKEKKTEPRIPLTVMVNPTITDSGKTTDWLDEGCLSVPNIELPVERSTQVNVLAEDLNGHRIKIRAKDLFARILQHEIDHLNGVLITQRAYPRTNELAGLKVLFMGTPAHVNGYVAALAATGVDFLGVVTETDKPTGRKQTLAAPPAKQFAEQLGVPVYQFASLKDSKVIKQLKALKPDLIIVAAYGKILPKTVLDLPKYGCLNIHYSLLPALRGPSPHQTAILQGLKETGYSIFKLDTGVDTGPILAQKRVRIDTHDTSQSLLEKMALQSTATLLDVLPGYIAGERSLKPQNKLKVSTTQLLTKEDGLIDWTLPIEQVDRQIRAMWPWPIAYTEVDGERLLIHAAHLKNDQLILDLVQPAGKRPMTGSDYFRGNPTNRLTFFERTGKVKTC